MLLYSTGIKWFVTVAIIMYSRQDLGLAQSRHIIPPLSNHFRNTNAHHYDSIQSTENDIRIKKLIIKIELKMFFIWIDFSNDMDIPYVNKWCTFTDRTCNYNNFSQMQKSRISKRTRLFRSVTILYLFIFLYVLFYSYILIPCEFRRICPLLTVKGNVNKCMSPWFCWLSLNHTV